MQIDDNATKILELLAKDANRKRIQISKDVGISEASLSKKISAMEASGIISRFTIDIDQSKLGYPINGISLIRLEHQSDDKIREVLGALEKLNTAIEYASVLGDYDFFVRWCCRDNSHLLASLKILLAVDGVKVETLTFGDHFTRPLYQFDAFQHAKLGPL
jgi:DNA-binding Lrp family transcriptional regulator